VAYSGWTGRCSLFLQPVPLLPWPALSGHPPSTEPALALVLQLPGGRRAALAVRRLLGWVGGQGLQAGGVRSAASGRLPMVTVTLDGQRRSHIAVNLAELAQALT